MKLIYIVDFPVIASSGNYKATREKGRSLKKNKRLEGFKFWYPNEAKGILGTIYTRFVFDIMCAFKLLNLNNDSIIIQRVFILPFTLLVAKVKRIKMINEFHADLSEEIQHLDKSGFEKNILRVVAMLSNINIRLGDGVIYNHPILLNKFNHLYKVPSMYSYNGSNSKDFFPQDVLKCRDELNIDPSIKLSLFLGSVSKWHGVDYLINMFNNPEMIELKDHYLYVVGASINDYTKKLKLTCKNPRIVFVEPVGSDKARKYINAADYCLLPVKQIRTSPGSPLKLYDYIACGKPVITHPDILGYSDEVKEYKLGALVPFEKEEAALKYKEAVEQIDFSYHIENNVKVAKEKVNWDNRMDTWVSFLYDNFEK